MLFSVMRREADIIFCLGSCEVIFNMTNRMRALHVGSAKLKSVLSQSYADALITSSSMFFVPPHITVRESILP